jgi:hypothetical protein
MLRRVAERLRGRRPAARPTPVASRRTLVYAPVLVVGRDGGTLEGLMLSSNPERDGQRHWFALGPGAWDRQQRPSWVRLDRVLTVAESGIRREGAVLDRARFDAIAAELRRSYGWH